MLRTSTDPRTRAQRYADSRWWSDGVKTVGYAIRCPEMDGIPGGRPGRQIYSVEMLYWNGHKRTRFVAVSDVICEVHGKRFHAIAWDRSLLEQRLV